MEKHEALERLLKAYSGYYNINRETPMKPFAAEASFEKHDEQYFLMKSAKLSEADSREYLFFALEEVLTCDRLLELDRLAWEECLRRTVPEENHKNTDAALLILADRVEEEALPLIRRMRHYKSYRFGLRGFSSYRLLVCEMTTEKMTTNRTADAHLRAFRNVLL